MSNNKISDKEKVVQKVEYYKSKISNSTQYKLEKAQEQLRHEKNSKMVEKTIHLYISLITLMIAIVFNTDEVNPLNILIPIIIILGIICAVAYVIFRKEEEDAFLKLVILDNFEHEISEFY